MVKDSELLDTLLRAPGKTLSFREFERLLRAFGFVLARRRGSHCAYKHSQVPELLTIQPHGKDARPYQVRKFLAMRERFHLELEE